LAELRVRPGGLAPLFERLVDGEPPRYLQPEPPQTLDPEAMRGSVKRELERLLNTRCSARTDPNDDRELTVLEYGIPDLVSYALHGAEDTRRLGQLIQRAVTAYEPRLRHVRVTVTSQRTLDLSLGLRVDAQLHIEPLLEPVWFVITVRPKTGEVEVESGA